MYKRINALVSAQNDHEASYIPYVRSFTQASQDFEGLRKAADGTVKSMKRKRLQPSDPRQRPLRKRPEGL